MSFIIKTPTQTFTEFYEDAKLLRMAHSIIVIALGVFWRGMRDYSGQSILCCCWCYWKVYEYSDGVTKFRLFINVNFWISIERYSFKTFPAEQIKYHLQLFESYKKSNWFIILLLWVHVWSFFSTLIRIHSLQGS